ncbi:hypothetical protein SAMN05216378_4030 [Paenibacillus catalpae]|uniref:N-acetyltransferase domain-containing protein n=1 Tax=Paenibacillus catalpae TaxID=1045775 RepID=A0A1I2DAF1_9BACL|nr:hypothetical protein [Paenibacillus catalpae]SFE77448.1 hypothetical protein SAMN05216378_4030 [Paenibacillus catalpae]
MSYDFSVSATAVYQEKYIQFLLQNYEDLNQPYPFPVTLSYISSPLLMEGKAILCKNEDGETVGAMGYIHGTGEQDYEDTEVIQLQIVFLHQTRRGSRLLLRAAQFLAQHWDQVQQPPSEIRFWIPNDPSLLRLCSRFANRFTENASLTEFRVSFTSFKAFVLQYNHENYYAEAGGR